MKKITSLLLAFLLLSFVSQAQKLREIPEQVKYAFNKQYADAQSVEYKDYFTSVSVYFTTDSAKMIAKYDNKGNWKETERESSLDDLSQDVKDGLNKSKYADWTVEEVATIIAPNTEDKYRIKVSRNDVQKKYLYFNKAGRLVRDAITIL